MTPAFASCSVKCVFYFRPRPRLWTVVILCLAVGIAPITLRAQTFTDMHDFNCNPDGCNGSYPAIPAQGRDGNMYGTLLGGASGNGTVYKITPSGTFTPLYTFSGADGSEPHSGLALGTDGNFYGATLHGGANGYGTIFKITPAGALTTLHSFTATEEGGAYGAPVQGKNGTFYGVTSYGKAYSVTSSGTFKLLPKAIPGASYAPLFLAWDGNFYGTTKTGGIGYGTIFQMSALGAVKILYSFDITHGSYPIGPVVQGIDQPFDRFNRTLYGTTSGGGALAQDVGVVYGFRPTGEGWMLHEFDSTSATDGYQPFAGLVAATDGYFYGSTNVGGGSSPYGTLFRLDSPTGSFSVLHVFDQTHGSDTQATAMQHTNGTLYGLTNQGGSGNGGVFYSLAMGIPPFVSLVGFPSGTAGTTVEILGSGFTGTTDVRFGYGSSSFTVVSDTYMTAVVSSSSFTSSVSVITPNSYFRSAQTFKVLPVILSFKPSSGPVGTQVVITGTGLWFANKVTFGGVKATSFTVNSGTQVTATVPTGALTGKIGITTNSGTTTADSASIFTVNRFLLRNRK